MGKYRDLEYRSWDDPNCQVTSLKLVTFRDLATPYKEEKKNGKKSKRTRSKSRRNK